jgi:hypothetical protein
MTGAEELDRYGRWSQDPEYGPLWFPQDVGPGWAPYTMGRWLWVEPWGWTWVDAAPWGFAPFHYGRWVQRGSRWGWAPGRYEHRPVYAPALVGWVGGPPPHRPGVDINISIGRGGPRNWYPLGPRDHHERWRREDPRDSRFERDRERDRNRDERNRDGRDARQPRPAERALTPPPRADQGRGAPHEISTLPPAGAAGRDAGVAPPLPNRPREDDRRDRRPPERVPGPEDRLAVPAPRAPGLAPPVAPQVMPPSGGLTPPVPDRPRQEERRDRRPSERAPGFEAPPAAAPSRAPVFNPPPAPQVMPPMAPPAAPPVVAPRGAINPPARVEPPPAPPPRVMPPPPPPPASPREVEQRRPEPVRGMERRRPEPSRDEADPRRQRPEPVFPNGPADAERERRRAN